jgi:transmembrane sensor
MSRGEFQKIAERYMAGECTPEEIDFVEKWVELNGIISNDHLVFESEAEATKTEEEVWSHIKELVSAPEARTVWWHNKWLLPGVAACVISLLSIGLLYDNGNLETKDLVMTGVETSNTSSMPHRILLADSSVVTLAAGARILISENYGQQTRTLRLIGEALFEIRRNPKLPFLVYSGDLITEVLGTSFVIRPEAGKKTIEVSVVTGKVSVYSNKKNHNQRRNGVIITRNQKAVYDTESKTIRQDLVDQPKTMLKDPPSSMFNFDETRVETVLSNLQQAYGMEIVVSNPALNECVFTGNLNGFNLFQQLDYVCDIIDAQYDVRGTTIFLTGEGCKKSRLN